MMNCPDDIILFLFHLKFEIDKNGLKNHFQVISSECTFHTLFYEFNKFNFFCVKTFLITF